MSPGTVTGRITEVRGKEQVTATHRIQRHCVLLTLTDTCYWSLPADRRHYRHTALQQCRLSVCGAWSLGTRLHTVGAVQKNHHQLNAVDEKKLYTTSSARAHDAFARRQPSVADTV